MWNDISREWRADCLTGSVDRCRIRIINREALVAEVARAVQRRWNGVDEGRSLDLGFAIIVHEEEGLVFPDGTADGSSKLVPYVGRLGLVQGIEVAPRVGDRIAVEFERFSVKRVGARTGLGGHNAAATPILGGINAGENLELLYGLDRWLHHDRIKGVFVVDDAVH